MGSVTRERFLTIVVLAFLLANSFLFTDLFLSAYLDPSKQTTVTIDINKHNEAHLEAVLMVLFWACTMYLIIIKWRRIGNKQRSAP